LLYSKFRILYGTERHKLLFNRIPIATAQIKFSQAEPPEIGSKPGLRDRFGILKMRWGVGRMNYSISPGLCRLGKPDENSPVLVTANCKMTLNLLRSQLGDLGAWILVLNTHGINVWCAAGKGSFGTDEVIQQIELANMISVVAHREVILLLFSRSVWVKMSSDMRDNSEAFFHKG
jgi:hypothetical protein